MNYDILGEIIDSDNFTVGGGSASAIAGAMAAGIVSMVSKLSMKKPEKLTIEEYDKISRQADELAKQLLQGAEDDKRAYCMIKEAYALPKNTAEEKQLRSKATSEAGKKAAGVPRVNGYRNKEVNELCLSLIDNSNPAAASDLYSALYLSEAGIKGCIQNIKVNLPLIKDDNAIQAFVKDIKILERNK
jgi:formiminotetrahydrofolate cyclodeaminase